jgi:hypothetical protein
MSPPLDERVDMTTLASVFTLRHDPVRLGNGLDPIGCLLRCQGPEAVTVARGFETQAANGSRPQWPENNKLTARNACHDLRSQSDTVRVLRR